MSIQIVLVIQTLIAFHKISVNTQSFEENALELSDNYCKDGKTCNYKYEDIRILYTTHYDILEIQINENFTQVNNPKNIISNISDPTEVYYSLRGNYIVYETIGDLFISPLDTNLPNRIEIKNIRKIPNIVKPNSKLSIDWIHDLFYWVKKQSKIVVALITRLNEPIVIVSKIYDSIRHLAINPIDSFIIWVEYDHENSNNVLFKASQDGSNSVEIFTTEVFIKRLEIDYQTERIFYALAHELFSINYYGYDKQLVISESTNIFQFEILGHFIYWIEYNSNQFFRRNISQFQTMGISNQILSLSHDINKFRVMDYLRQPNATNRCSHSNCSRLCLPVDVEHFRCVCDLPNCTDSSDLQLVHESDHKLDVISHKYFPTSLPTLQQNNTTLTTILNHENHYPLPNVTDSQINLNVTEVFNETKNNTHIISTESSVNLQTITNSSITETSFSEINMNTDKEYRSTIYQNVIQNLDKYVNHENEDKQFKLISTNKTNVKIEQITENFTESVILVDQLSKYEDIKISWHNLLICGISIFIVGLFIGSLISTFSIRVYAKKNCDISYNTNTNNKWDYVGFKKAEGNIYFGAKYRVKDESLY